jgi:DNA-binding transcriptional MerR regulator
MGGSDEYSIDELAQRAGSNVRNVRLYQERGLLPPPRRVGRSNRYGPEHLARVQLIMAMLGKGYPLAAIRELLDAWEGQRSLADILGFEQVVSAPFVTEEPRHYTADELGALFPVEQSAAADKARRRAVEMALVVPDEDGDGFTAPSPSIIDAGVQLVEDGVPVEAVLDVAAAVRKATDQLADSFVSMFLRHVWEPFVAAGMPPERLPEITAALERQRPLAAQAVLPALAQAMQRRVEEVSAEHTAAAARAGSGKRKGRRAS